MKIFSFKSRMTASGPQVSEITCTLTIDEVRYIADAVTKMKPSGNDVVESIKFSLIETLKSV